MNARVSVLVNAWLVGRLDAEVAGHQLLGRVECPDGGDVPGPIRLASTRPTTLDRGTRSPAGRHRPRPPAQGGVPARTRSAGSVPDPRTHVHRRGEGEVQLQVRETRVDHCCRHMFEMGDHLGWVCRSPYMSPSSPPPHGGFHQVRSGPVSTPSVRCRAIQSGWRRATSESGATRNGGEPEPGRAAGRPDRGCQAARSEGTVHWSRASRRWRPGYPSSTWNTSKGQSSARARLDRMSASVTSWKYWYQLHQPTWYGRRPGRRPVPRSGRPTPRAARRAASLRSGDLDGMEGAAFAGAEHRVAQERLGADLGCRRVLHGSRRVPSWRSPPSKPIRTVPTRAHGQDRHPIRTGARRVGRVAGRRGGRAWRNSRSARSDGSVSMPEYPGRRRRPRLVPVSEHPHRPVGVVQAVDQGDRPHRDSPVAPVWPRPTWRRCRSGPGRPRAGRGRPGSRSR